MKTKVLATILLTMVASVSVSAQLPATQTRKPKAKEKMAVAAAPDLRISEYVFTKPKNDAEVKKYVVAKDNAGEGTSMSAATFSLVAARFKNSGGNYNNLINSDKGVLVHVLNAGNSATTPCRLMLTIRKINGISANRQKVATVAALAPHQDVWVLIDASSILPNNVGLEATSFKLNVDATNLVNELSESNNEALHNP